MPLSPKLKSSNVINEEELIRKGGSAGGLDSNITPEVSAFKRVQLRIPLNDLDRIGALLAARTGNISRHTWILEAIAEKLGKDENGSEVTITSSRP